MTVEACAARIAQDVNRLIEDIRLEREDKAF